MTHPSLPAVRTARFAIGAVVRHRDAAFQGVVIDVDAEWPGAAGVPVGDQARRPFYQVFALGPDGGFIAYAAEAVLEADPEQADLSPEDRARWFATDAAGHCAPRDHAIH